MSNISNEQLFTELTPAEGANVTGGATYYIGNKTGIGVNYNINGDKEYLKPNEERRYSYSRDPKVEYDSKIGPGYKPETKYARRGRNNFDRDGNYLFLGTGKPGPVPTAV